MAPQGERGGRLSTVGGAVALALVGLAAGAVWLASAEVHRSRLPDGNVELVTTRRPWVAPSQALCVVGGACVDVPVNDGWRVELDDPLVVRGGDWIHLHDEVVLDSATGRELRRTDHGTAPGVVAFASIPPPVRWRDVVLELLPAPHGSALRVFDAHTGELRFDEPLGVVVAELTPVDDMTFRIDGGDAVFEMTMPAGPVRSIVPTGATSACLADAFLFSGRDGSLGVADARGEGDVVIARPGLGGVAGCSVIRDAVVVTWARAPTSPSGDVETAVPIDAGSAIDHGLALYVLDAASRGLRYAVALPGAESANLETCRSSPGDEAAMGACRGDVGITGPDHAATFDLGPDGLVLVPR